VQSQICIIHNPRHNQFFFLIMLMDITGSDQVSSYNLPWRHTRWVQVYLYPLFNFAARWDVWSTPSSGRLLPGMTRYPLYRKLSGSHCTYAKNLAPTGVRSPDRPARSECLMLIGLVSPRRKFLVTGLRTGQVEFTPHHLPYFPNIHFNTVLFRI
jgi:hypothetical protein